MRDVNVSNDHGGKRLSFLPPCLISTYSRLTKDRLMRPCRSSRMSTTALAVLAILMASCQSKPAIVMTDAHSALSTMERVAVGANSCWFKSADPAFASYSMAPELNSYTGRPRILVVQRNNPAGRPLLVVQAEGNPAKMEAFGPMMTGQNSARITGDVRRWANGAKNC
jgi:hypothetical protein